MRPLHTRRKRATLSDARTFISAGIGGGMSQDDYLSDEERERIAEGVADQLFEVTKLYFPRTAVLEYAVLKAHLIVEFALTQFIRCASHVLVDPDDLRFTFTQKLDIAALLGFGVGSPTLIPSVELINRIRNQAAHRFGIDRTLVDDLIRINSENIDITSLNDKQRISWLRQLCYFICGEIAGWLRMLITYTSREEHSSSA